MGTRRAADFSMAKQNKKSQVDKFSLADCKIRPVNKADKWCWRRSANPKDQEARWGYIVTLPYTPKQNTLLECVDGHIVRTKKHCDKLMLQIIKKDDAPSYGLKSFARKEPNKSKKKRRNKKKLHRILNIKRLREANSAW